MPIRLKALPFLLVILLLAMQGVRATPLSVLDANGKKVTLLQDKSRKATVLLFVTNDCPITNSYAPEIKRLYEAYHEKKIAFYLVYADPELKAPVVRQHGKDYRLPCPALLDPTHLLVHFTQATITPQAVILAPDGKRLYLGRIDDRYIDFGKARYAATTHDLRTALDAVLQGKPVPHPTTKAIGCYIPDVASH
ncbi:MAG: Redoxin domain protein [Chthonomonadales bacterium]|nr:Redoxin domain protein [Chthonomonadales bacterium]